MTERVVVIGAGMAGLMTALALARPDREITLLERDPPPPGGGPDAAFEGWARRGVGQLRHSHAFLARLRGIIKDRHSALLADLIAGGCREIGFVDALPARLKADYKPEPGDADMVVLTARRTTFELITRRYVERLAGVDLIPNTFVRELIIENGAGRPRVLGAGGDRQGRAREWRADITVDAAGQWSQAGEQLLVTGGAASLEEEDCGILYYTRHYRLIADEPPPSRAPGTGDLGFIKYGRFPGDDGWFSITLAVPEIETELRQAIVDPEVFDAICALLPGVAGWTDPATAEPASAVFGMGNLKSSWRSLIAPDRQAILGVFAVGDSLIRTNPLYGRGCTFAAVQAGLLALVLDETADPAARARLYDARVKAELTPYYDDMRRQDRAAVARALALRHPVGEPRVGERLVRSFANDGVRVALRSDIDLARAALRDFHMIDRPGAWLKSPENLAKVMGWWARGKRLNADRYPPPLGPTRPRLLAALGLPN